MLRINYVPISRRNSFGRFDQDFQVGMPLSWKDKLRSETKRFLDISEWANPIAATLTCKKARHDGWSIEYANPIKCSKNLRHVLNILKKKTNQRRPLPVVAVLEQAGDGRYHYHLAIDAPKRCCPDWFCSVLEEAWRKSFWGHRETCCKKADRGWIHYITKLRGKKDFGDAIDWQNVNLSIDS